MKGNLARLAPAVERELREAEVRRERRRANERVAYLAYHDPLTELPNRVLLQDRLHQATLTCRRDGKPLALLTLDLDGFKEVNDVLGHHAGDRVLQQVAARLRLTLRESDTVARFGGDEFAVLLPLADADGAELTARKILAALEEPVVVDGRPLAVHGSIGIACFPVHAASGEELMQKADVAMYSPRASNRATRCIRPSATATPSIGCHSWRPCGAVSTASSSCWTTSQSSTWIPLACRPSRLCSDGTIRSRGACCPRTSSGWPSTPD